MDRQATGPMIGSMEQDRTEILYNAECLVCRYEIDHYRDYAARAGLPLKFDDLNGPDLARWGLTADQAARRFYVLHQGSLLSGIPAFLVLWAEMPRYRWLGRLIGLPGLRQAATRLYDHIAAPLIYRWHLRRNQQAR